MYVCKLNSLSNSMHERSVCLISHIENDSEGMTFEGDFLFLNFFSVMALSPPHHHPPPLLFLSKPPTPCYSTVHTVSEGLREEKASIPFIQLEQGRNIIIIIIIIITLP